MEAHAISLAMPATARLVVVPRSAPGEDERLLERIADGDHAAFEILYRRYARPVLALAQRRLGDAGRAEEALQEAFVSVWRSPRRTVPSEGQPLPGSTRSHEMRSPIEVGDARELPAEPSDQPSPDAGPDEQAEQSGCAGACTRAREALNETSGS